MSNPCGFVYSFLVFFSTVLYECLGLFVSQRDLCVSMMFGLWKFYYECLQLFCFKHLRINLQVLIFLSQSCVQNSISACYISSIDSFYFFVNIASFSHQFCGRIFSVHSPHNKNVTSFFSKTQINTKWELTRCKA